ncbi:LuxR family two component transcriptional regulator [Tenacibaculum adriaticum]|uniref:LuxR family two component transcriptional regulator n=1 Tax=Tenacibaculum adriaticum TaxID=413713 RepID=A0A5S5DVZ9_9FLAO|nr:response regulator transcription factor [Tenacibaculum adriaticum]TYP99894.1 LuxR family two component transcriptional regulator [Tenacibaculum adriaticum]
MKKIEVVLVDDHQLFIEGVIALMKTEQYFNVISFNKAASALAKLSDYCPDILIADMSMPEMNGLELIQKVKKVHKNLIILVVSANEKMIPYHLIDGYLNKSECAFKLISIIKNIVLENIDYSKPQKPITNREKEIITLITKGHKLEKIASLTNTSSHTVITHKKNIYKKLEINSITELVKKAFYLGLVD